jgi:hypothetical protein
MRLRDFEDGFRSTNFVIAEEFSAYSSDYRSLMQRIFLPIILKLLKWKIMKFIHYSKAINKRFVKILFGICKRFGLCLIAKIIAFAYNLKAFLIRFAQNVFAFVPIF